MNASTTPFRPMTLEESITARGQLRILAMRAAEDEADRDITAGNLGQPLTSAQVRERIQAIRRRRQLH